MPSFEYKGHKFEVDHEPTPEEFAQAAAYFDSLGPKDEEEPSQLKAFGKSAVEHTLPTLAGLAAMGPGASLGAAVGTGIGRVLGGVGGSVAGPVGAIGGALAGGVGGGYLGGKIQEGITSLIPDSVKEATGFDESTRQAETQAYPTTSFLGGMAPSLLAFRPGSLDPIEVGNKVVSPLMQRGIMAGAGSGMELGSQLLGDDPLNPLHIGLAGAFGGIAATPTKFGQKLLEVTTPGLGTPKVDLRGSKTPTFIESDEGRTFFTQRLEETRSRLQEREAEFSNREEQGLTPEENRQLVELRNEIKEYEEALGIKQPEPVVIAPKEEVAPVEATAEPVVEAVVPPKERHEQVKDLFEKKTEIWDREAVIEKAYAEKQLTDIEYAKAINGINREKLDVLKQIKDLPEYTIKNKANPTEADLINLVSTHDTYEGLLRTLQKEKIGDKVTLHLIDKLLEHQSIKGVGLDFHGKPIEFQGKSNSDYSGFYDPSGHSIYFNPKKGFKLKTIVHEGFHAALVNFMENNPRHPTVKRLQQLYDEFRKTVDPTLKIHALTDVHEFIAEGFTNPNFQRFLSTRYMLIPTGTKGKLTYWGEFKKAVKDILARTLKIEPNGLSALDQFIELGGRLMEQTKGRPQGYTIPQYAKPKGALSKQPSIAFARVDANVPSLGDTNGIRDGIKMGAYTDLPRITALVASNIFGKLGFGKIFEHPLIQYSIKAIRKGEAITSSFKNDLLNGYISEGQWQAANDKKTVGISLQRLKNEKSVANLLPKIKDSDLVAIMDAFKQNFRKKTHEETLAEFGSKWTTEQKDLAIALTHMWKRQLDLVNRRLFESRLEELKRWDEKRVAEGGTKMGPNGPEPRVKPIKGEKLAEIANRLAIQESKGWYPAVRRGEFEVTVSFNGLPFRMESFRTKEQAQAFKNKYESVKGKDTTVSEVTRRAKEDTAEQFLEGLRAASDYLKEKNGEVVIDELIQQIQTMGGKIGKHHQFRENYKGYLGDQAFRSERKNAQDWRDSIVSSVEDYSATAGKLTVGKYLRPLLDAVNMENALPNTHEAIQTLYDHALNRNNRIPDKSADFKWFHHIIHGSTWLKERIDSGAIRTAKLFGKEWYPEKVGVADRTLGILSHMFYMTTLTTRPGFWLGQALTTPTAFRQLLRDTNTLDALASGGKGMLNLLKPSKEFLEAVHYLSQIESNPVFHPQLMNEITNIPFVNKESAGGKILGILSGETPAAAADAFSRYWTFSMMFEHYKSQGLKGKELYQKAAQETDATMVQYGRKDKAPIFDKLGVVGEAAGPLTTFANAQLANLVADLKLIKDTPGAIDKLRNSAPFIATMMATMLLGGAIGAPLVAEYELLRLFLINTGIIAEETLPSAVEFLLKRDDPTLSHGILATTGFDLGSSMRWNPIISGAISGQEGFLSIFPALAYGKQLGSSLVTGVSSMLGKQIPTAEERKQTLAITPGAYKGLVDLGFNSLDRMAVPGNKRGYATIEQSADDIVGQFLGSKPIDAAKNNAITFLTSSKEQRRTEDKQRAMDLLTDAVSERNKFKEKFAIEKLIKLGVPPEQIKSNLLQLQKNRIVPEQQRFFSGTSGKVSSPDQRRKALEMLPYMDGE